MCDRNGQLNLPLIVDPANLSEYMTSLGERANICIVDLSSKENYIQGHIPGAVFLPFQSLISGKASAPGTLPDQAQLLEVFNYLAMENDTHFIVCDDEGGGWAGRFIWTLDIVSHKHYSYLDGGMIAWKAAGLPLETGQGQPRPSVTPIAKLSVDHTALTQLPTIMKGLDKNQFVIWDARSPQEYAGLRVFAKKGGHIPGAVNVEWTTLMDPKRHYKIREDAKVFLIQEGIDGSLPIITHCQTHHRSGFTYLVGLSLGYDIRAYDGSWAEWGNHPDTPVSNLNR